MEAIKEYVTDSTIDRRAARCPGCGIPFGHEVEGGKFLRVGSLRVQKLAAICAMPLCGHRIWWTAADRHLKKIEKRVYNRSNT